MPDNMQISSTARPILCYVTDRASLPQRTERVDSFLPLLDCIAAAAAAGVDWIQLREKDLPASACAALTSAAVARVRFGAEEGSFAECNRILVNDRLDVALAENADGVHLGENSLPIAEARRLLHHLFVGKSAAAISRRRFLPFRGVGYGGCRGRRRLHFLWPYLCHARETKIRRTARCGAPCGSVPLGADSGSRHWRHEP